MCNNGVCSGPSCPGCSPGGRGTPGRDGHSGSAVNHRRCGAVRDKRGLDMLVLEKGAEDVAELVQVSHAEPAVGLLDHVDGVVDDLEDLG